MSRPTDLSLQRYWVNQPLNSQPAHHLHGKNVLADPIAVKRARGSMVTVYLYFENSSLPSFEVSTLALSEGWREKKVGIER